MKRIRTFSHDKTGRCEPRAAGDPGSASCQSQTEGTKPTSREKQKLESKNILTGLLQLEAPRLPELLLSCLPKLHIGGGGWGVCVGAPWHPFRNLSSAKTVLSLSFAICIPKTLNWCGNGNAWKLGSNKAKVFERPHYLPLADLNQGGQAREESKPFLQLSSPELQM